MRLNEILPKALRLYPQKEAVVCQDTRMNYSEFAERVWRLSQALMDLGIKKQDRIGIIHENSNEFLETYFAAAHIGAILVPLNFRLSAKEIATILLDSQSRILIAQGVFENIIQEIPQQAPCVEKIVITRTPETFAPSPIQARYETLLAGASSSPPPELTIEDSDIAQLYYTSGTTGRSKGVILTHKNVGSHALGTIAELHLTDRDNWFHVAPLFHLADAWATFAVTWVGGKHVIQPVFESLSVMKLIEREKITLSNLIPTMLNMMVNHPDLHQFDYSSLRVILSGGAPIAPETVRKIVDAFKCDYIQTYGMTETSPYLTMSILKEHLKELPPEEQLTFKAKTGREFININLRVVDEKNNDVAVDNRQVGEIIVKGDSVTPGYWKLPQETEKAFKNGWLYTGDLAVIDSERYVTIVDRKKDMILTGGENVYSTEVENVLYMHPDVLEAAVIGMPDSHWGETVKAFVVLKEGRKATEQEIIAFCKKELARYKAPKSIDFLDALPKTGSGKIYKKGLRNPQTSP